jgi:hypothetical protein
MREKKVIAVYNADEKKIVAIFSDNKKMAKFIYGNERSLTTVSSNISEALRHNYLIRKNSLGYPVALRYAKSQHVEMLGGYDELIIVNKKKECV